MIDMSDFQFGIYLKARAVERKQESARAKKQKKQRQRTNLENP